MDEDQKEDYNNDSYYLIFLFSGFVATYINPQDGTGKQTKWHVSSFFSVSLLSMLSSQLYYPTPFHSSSWPSSSHVSDLRATHFSACLLNTWLVLWIVLASSKESEEQSSEMTCQVYRNMSENYMSSRLILLEALLKSVDFPRVPLHFFWRQSYSSRALLSHVTLYIPSTAYISGYCDWGLFLFPVQSWNPL